jgi:hypothetical protein
MTTGLGARQQGQFIGADSSDVLNNLFGGMVGGNNAAGMYNARGPNAGRAGTNAFNAAGGRNNAAGGRNNAAAGRGNMTNRTLPRRLVVAFEYRSPQPVQITSTMTRRLAGGSRIASLAPIEVGVSERTAILRGTVATVHDRDLAEQLALLEPGISDVRNEIQVAESVTLPPAQQETSPPDQRQTGSAENLPSQGSR